MRGLLLATTCALGLALPAAAAANPIDVTTQADETGPNNACSLREAISAANDNNTGPGNDCTAGSGADVINLPASANPYQVTGAANEPNNATGDLNITSDMTISGAGANTTTIQSDGNDRVIDIAIPSNSVTIRDLTITGGHAPPGPDAGGATMSGNDSTGGAGDIGGFGGGVFSESAALTLTRVVISGNTAGNGSDGGPGGTATGGTNPGGSSTGGSGGAGGPGGGVATAGDLTITDSTIANNHAGNGGTGGPGGTAGTGGDASTGHPGGDSQGGQGGEGGHGGGLWVAHGKTLTLTRSVIQGNHAGNGGTGGGTGTPGAGGQGSTGPGGLGGCACANDGGRGGDGGGIALEPGSSVISDAIIRDNSSGAGAVGGAAGTGANGGLGTPQGAGGGSEAGGGGNSGDYAGAELTATNGNLQSVSNSAIYGNVTPNGGQGGGAGAGGSGSTAGQSFGGGGGAGGSTPGIGVIEPSLVTHTLTNVTVASNSAGAGGTGGDGGTGPAHSNGGVGGPGGSDAGVRIDQQTNAVLNHLTISGNTVGGSGSGGGGGTAPVQTPGGGGSPGIGGGVTNQSNGTVTLRNSIVANNSVPNCRSTITNGGHNLSFPATDNSCHAAVVGDPLLGPIQNNGGFTPTMALGAGSPAIDAVPSTGASCAPTDQRGMPRPQGAACDIGAFEFALPTIRLSSPVNGRRYRKGAHVLASYSCAEAGAATFIASCVGTVPSGHAINTSTPGTKTFSVTATDTAGNHITRTVHYFVDGSRPTITIKTPKDGATYRKGKKVKASYSCNDIDGRFDVKSCRGTVKNGKRINTSKTGKHAFTVVAIDRVGNRTVKTVHYKVKKKKKKK